MRLIGTLAAVALLSGCALNMRLLEDGKIHQGTFDYAGGRLSAMIDGDAYSGPVSRGMGFGLSQGLVGTRPMMATTTMFSDQFQGLLTNAAGRVIRCQIQSAGGRGNGICQDNNGRTYDVLIGGDDPRGMFAK